MLRLFSLSPKHIHVILEGQEVLHDQKCQLSLVQPGDTRWTSYYHTIRAVVKCLQSIVAALQHSLGKVCVPTSAGQF